MHDKILVTGAAGFIGSHVCRRLVDRGAEVVGVDNLGDYYDVRLKEARLEQLRGQARFRFVKFCLSERTAVADLFAAERPAVVIHLAAQTGVRYSLVNPQAYVDSNLVGFANVLEGCRHARTQHLVYASSSSVYGGNTRLPFTTHDGADHPLSLYAASKKANELMAHSYAHLFGLPCTGLRFFTVYGPWGRPDMALFLFTKAILEDRPIDVFDGGRPLRDFTYVDDVVEAIIRVAERPARPSPIWSGDRPDPATSSAPYQLYNVGASTPVAVMRVIQVLETCLGRQARMNLLPAQPEDVPATRADVDDLTRDFDYRPETPLETGVARFVEWYREFYRV